MAAELEEALETTSAAWPHDAQPSGSPAHGQLQTPKKHPRAKSQWSKSSGPSLAMGNAEGDVDAGDPEARAKNIGRG